MAAISRRRHDNGAALELVWCEAGQFTMGSPANERERDPIEQQVEVVLEKGFWMGATEVTQGQWKRVMESSPWTEADYCVQGANYPAGNLSYFDCLEFCDALTKQEHSAGRLFDSAHYSLPTEAQWEFACRAGTTTAYSFGDDERTIGEYAWWGGFGSCGPSGGKGNSASEQHFREVALLKANAWGFFDMHGNIGEWCLDGFSDALPGGSNPVGKSPDKKVWRGGTWASEPRRCRSAFRGRMPPSTRSNGMGFRVVLIAD